MLSGHLLRPAAWRPCIVSPLFQESLAWIERHRGAFVDGIHELGRPGWYVNVHGYTTQGREQGFWENHAVTIDLQYVFSGSEIIDVLPVEELGAPSLVQPEKDLQKFASNDRPFSSLLMQPDDFVFLFPGEAHRPKVAVSHPEPVRKLVVKIPVALLAEETGCDAVG